MRIESVKASRFARKTVWNGKESVKVVEVTVKRRAK